MKSIDSVFSSPHHQPGIQLYLQSTVRQIKRQRKFDLTTIIVTDCSTASTANSLSDNRTYYYA
jgi:hypothetical protein